MVLPSFENGAIPSDFNLFDLGVESTIVAGGEAGLRLLRPGPITPEALARTAGTKFVATPGEAIEAPGMLASHYAPSRPLRLDAQAGMPGEWLIGFGAVTGDRSLSVTADLAEAAANLFDALHEADASGRSAIAVAPIPQDGLGLAINDRLRRAAAPRDDDRP